MALTDTSGKPNPDPLNALNEGMAGVAVTLLLLGAIAVGSGVGIFMPTLDGVFSAAVDPTLLCMVFLLFFEVRLGAVAKGYANWRFMTLAWGANFVIVPMVGFAIASLFLSGQELLFTGLIIYFISPCTDWFLGFTRLSIGSTALGAALIPVNMLTQLLLYPFWLWLFTRHTGLVDFAAIPSLLIQWFLVPFVLAQGLRFCLFKLLPSKAFEWILRAVAYGVPVVIAAVVLQIFAVNIGEIVAHLGAFVSILGAIFLFFVTTFIIGERLSRWARLPYPQHALLTMTTAARNAPLMLAVTAVAIPDQPLVLAAMVIGMLVEFPHLTALTQVLLRQRKRIAGLPA